MKYEYDAVLHETTDNGGAYVGFPWDIRQEFGKGRVKVHAEFDGIPYDGSIVNMGLKNEDGSVCYIIGVLKAIRKELDKSDGDMIHVVITERNQGDMWKCPKCGRGFSREGQSHFCKECDRLLECEGCEQCQGQPFGGSCVAERNKDFRILKRQLIDEINAFGIKGLAVTDLNLLTVLM